MYCGLYARCREVKQGRLYSPCSNAMFSLDVGVYGSGELVSSSLGLDEVGGGDPDEVDGLRGSRWLSVGSVVECG